MRVLALIGYYLPGYKSGGPLRTLGNMVYQLGDDIDFWIIARDRDATDSEPYPDIEVDAWNQAGKAKVYYASPGNLSFGMLRSVIDSVTPDVLYLNSFFSPMTIRCLLLQRTGKLPEIPVVVAPRGEFSPGALALKRFKKHLYIAVAKRLGLYTNILWQASSELERASISEVFPGSRVHIAPDVSAPVTPEKLRHRTKRLGEVRFVFLSRIAPKKNLHTLLKMLGTLSGSVSLSIVGPVRDSSYWQRCRRVIRTLPGHVKVDIIGSVPHEDVYGLFSRYHFFVLPTLGENFGHVILEALAAGVPVLISDQTPWQDLAQAGVGWDIPLQDEQQWHTVLQQCADMPQTEYEQMSNKARAYAVEWTADNSILQANRELFAKATASYKRISAG